MKTLLAVIGILGFLQTPSFSATNGVIVGANVQAVIDASGSGDTLFFEPGLYPDPVMISKPLTIAPAAGPLGGQIQFTGPVKIFNNGTNSIQQTFFGGTLETSNAVVTILDSTFNAGVLVNKGKMTLKRILTTSSAPVVLTNSASFEALRLKNLAPIDSYGITGTTNAQMMIVQSEIAHQLYLRKAKVWLGYNTTTFSGSVYLEGCDSVAIGNKFSSGSVSTSGYQFTQSEGTLKFYNNYVAGNSGMLIGSATAELLNSTVSALNNNTALYVANAAGPVTIKSCIVFNSQGGGTALNAPGSSALVFASYSLFYGGNAQSQAVVPFTQCIIGQDPKVSNYAPASDSPVINQGLPSTIYNNRDGTRNTMGYTGGAYLNPANYTNNNPMVFLLTGPQTILKGALSSIPITAAASAGH